MTTPPVMQPPSGQTAAKSQVKGQTGRQAAAGQQRTHFQELLERKDVPEPVSAAEPLRTAAPAPNRSAERLCRKTPELLASKQRPVKLESMTPQMQIGIVLQTAERPDTGVTEPEPAGSKVQQPATHFGFHFAPYRQAETADAGASERLPHHSGELDRGRHVPGNALLEPLADKPSERLQHALSRAGAPRPEARPLPAQRTEAKPNPNADQPPALKVVSAELPFLHAAKPATAVPLHDSDAVPPQREPHRRARAGSAGQARLPGTASETVPVRAKSEVQVLSLPFAPPITFRAPAESDGRTGLISKLRREADIIGSRTQSGRAEPVPPSAPEPQHAKSDKPERDVRSGSGAADARPVPAQQPSAGPAPDFSGLRQSYLAPEAAAQQILRHISEAETAYRTSPVSNSIEAAPRSLRLRLSPETLGEVEIRITREGGRLAIRIRAELRETAELLGNDTSILQERLDFIAAADARVEIEFAGSSSTGQLHGRADGMAGNAQGGTHREDMQREAAAQHASAPRKSGDPSQVDVAPDHGRQTPRGRPDVLLL